MEFLSPTHAKSQAKAKAKAICMLINKSLGKNNRTTVAFNYFRSCVAAINLWKVIEKEKAISVLKIRRGKFVH